MKLNKLQKVILFVGVIVYIALAISYFYQVKPTLIEWITYRKPSKEEIARCIEQRERVRMDYDQTPDGRLYKRGEAPPLGRLYGQDYETWLLEPENDSFVCNPSRPQLLTAKSVNHRQATIADSLFSYLTVGTVLTLLIILAKDRKR